MSKSRGALPRLIFVASPGRCGTRYLTEMLGLLTGVRAEHEPDPQFAESAWAAQWIPEVAANFWFKQKLPAINRRGGWHVYVETSHVVANGYLDVLFGLGIPFDIVVLTRDNRKVALSYWQRDSIPMRTEQGLIYLLNPAVPSNKVAPDNEALSSWNDYQLCYWHAVETEARQAEWLSMAQDRGRRAVKIDIEELNEREGVERVINWLELPEPEWAAVDELLGTRLNENPEDIACRAPTDSERQFALWEYEVLRACD